MKNNKIVILDRDGVINKYPGDRDYVKSWDEFKFLPRVKKALKMLKDSGFKIYIASNQAGVSKGIYSKGALEEITDKMQEELTLAGAKIDEAFYCTHRDEDNCDCRKPKTGLLRKAINEPNENTYFVGDTLRDIQTGNDFGCKTILVLSGKVKQASEIKDWSLKPDFVAINLFEAAKAIVNNKI